MQINLDKNKYTLRKMRQEKFILTQFINKITEFVDFNVSIK